MQISLHCPQNVDYMMEIATKVPIEYISKYPIQRCPDVLNTGLAVLGQM